MGKTGADGDRCQNTGKDVALISFTVLSEVTPINL